MAAIIRWASNSLSSALDMNSATLSGAIDVIVVEQADGLLLSSPFHVRFGKLQLFKSKGEIVHIRVNGAETPLKMRLGSAGEAFFVERVRDEIEVEPPPAVVETSGDGEAAAAEEEDEVKEEPGLTETTTVTTIDADDEDPAPEPVEEPPEEEAESKKPDLSALLPKWYTERHLPDAQRETLVAALESRAQKLSRDPVDDEVSVASSVIDSETAIESGAESGPEEDAEKDRSWIWSYGSLPKKLPFSLSNKDLEPPDEDDDDVVRAVLESLVVRVETAATPPPPSVGGARSFVRMLWSRTVGSAQTRADGEPDIEQPPDQEQVPADDVVPPTEDPSPAEDAGVVAEATVEPEEQVAPDVTTADETPTTQEEPPAMTPGDDGTKEEKRERPKLGLLKTGDDDVEAVTAERYRREGASLLLDPRLRVLMHDGMYADLQTALPELVRSYAFPDDEEPKVSFEEPVVGRTRSDREPVVGRTRSDRDIPRLLSRSTESLAALREESTEDVTITELTSSDNLAAIVGFDQIHPDLSHTNLASLTRRAVGLPLDSAHPSSSTLASDDKSSTPPKPLALSSLSSSVSDTGPPPKQPPADDTKDDIDDTPPDDVAAPDDEAVPPVEQESPVPPADEKDPEVASPPRPAPEDEKEDDAGRRRREQSELAEGAKEDEIPKDDDDDDDHQKEDEVAKEEQRHPLTTSPDKVEHHQTKATTPKFPYRKTLRPSPRQIASLLLKRGANAVEFCVRKGRDEVVVSATVYRWPRGARCVFADIDGVVAGSFGAVQMPLKLLAKLSQKSKSSSGVAELFTAIDKHGYRIVYLTTRAIGVAAATREALRNVEGDMGLPRAPVLLAPGSLLDSGYYSGDFDATKFKAAALKNVVALFPGRNPLWAALARAQDDVSPYFDAGVPRGRVFRIFKDDDDPRTKPILGAFDKSGAVVSSYKRLADLVDQTFPAFSDDDTDRKSKILNDDQLDEQFNDLNFWKLPLTLPPKKAKILPTSSSGETKVAVKRPRANSDSSPWPIPLLRASGSSGTSGTASEKKSNVVPPPPPPDDKLPQVVDGGRQGSPSPPPPPDPASTQQPEGVVTDLPPMPPDIQTSSE